jgi:uncharacterized protein YbjT (DUF2867 family)
MHICASVGAAHLSPAKADQFAPSIWRHCAFRFAAAVKAHVRHFVFRQRRLACARHAGLAVREKCEQAIRESGLNATILRPWYVLGPGHR